MQSPPLGTKPGKPQKSWLSNRIDLVNAHKGWILLVSVASVASCAFGFWQYYTTVSVAEAVHPDIARIQSDDVKIQAAIEKARADIIEDNERHRLTPIFPYAQQGLPSSADGATLRQGTAVPALVEQKNTASEKTSKLARPLSVGSESKQQAEAWSTPTFTGATPIAVVAPHGEALYQENIAAASLRDLLSPRLHVVMDKKDATLVIEVSDVEIRKAITGHPCPNPSESTYSGLIASAKLSVRMVWAGGAVELPSQSLSNAVLTCDSVEDDVTHNLAFNQVIGVARDKILALAAQKASSQ